MPKSTKIVLGGNEVTITELPAIKNAEWRAGLNSEITVLVKAVMQASQIDLEKRDQEQLSQAGDVLLAVSARVIELPTVMRTKLFDYAPDLSHLAEVAYDSEIATAFLEVCKLAFPFGELASSLLPLVQKAVSGSRTKQTGSNLSASTVTK